MAQDVELIHQNAGIGSAWVLFPLPLGRPHPRQLALVGAVAKLLAAGLGVGHWERRKPVLVAVGGHLPLLPGAAIDPTHRSLHRRPLTGGEPGLAHAPGESPQRARPRTGPASIAALKRQGVRFFITPSGSPGLQQGAIHGEVLIAEQWLDLRERPSASPGTSP